MLARATAFAAILALALAYEAAPALADGDPASDVLATQQLFLPQDAGIPSAQQAQLAGLLQSAKRSGYPIRLALIASATDLGSVTELWRQPQTYARFLGQELALTYHGPLLVVMPDGFGFNGFNRPLSDVRAAVAGLSPSAAGAQLAVATEHAIQRLAAKSGHSLSLPATTDTASSAGSSGTLPWIALALGALIIAAAWAASLRARPLRMHNSARSADPGRRSPRPRRAQRADGRLD
ncbi:MAG TPA: hypothetical protein VGL78_04590 [Solirubrobacteraceae bacterium]